MCSVSFASGVCYFVAERWAVNITKRDKPIGERRIRWSDLSNFPLTCACYSPLATRLLSYRLGLGLSLGLGIGLGLISFECAHVDWILCLACMLDYSVTFPFISNAPYDTILRSLLSLARSLTHSLSALR